MDIDMIHNLAGLQLKELEVEPTVIDLIQVIISTAYTCGQADGIKTTLEIIKIKN